MGIIKNVKFYIFLYIFTNPQLNEIKLLFYRNNISNVHKERFVIKMSLIRKSLQEESLLQILRCKVSLYLNRIIPDLLFFLSVKVLQNCEQKVELTSRQEAARCDFLTKSLDVQLIRKLSFVVSVNNVDNEIILFHVLLFYFS